MQPIVGQASDRTWGPSGPAPALLSGRRDSEFDGADPDAAHASALWMAAGLLWVLDASINISMQPFRAFVADLLPESQCTRGFAMQSLFIGLGAVIASALPYLLTNVFHLAQARAAGTIPFTVRFSFYIGAAAFLIAVLWTIFTTKEYPPENMEEFRRQKAERAGIAAQARNPGFRPRNAAHDAATGLGPDLHLAGLVLHVALLSGRGGAQRFRRRRHEFSPVFRGSRVGGRLFWNVLAGVFRIFLRYCPRSRTSLAARQRTAFA